MKCFGRQGSGLQDVPKAAYAPTLVVVEGEPPGYSDQSRFSNLVARCSFSLDILIRIVSLLAGGRPPFWPFSGRLVLVVHQLGLDLVDSHLLLELRTLACSVSGLLAVEVT